MTEARVVFMTAPDAAVAEDVVRTLVAERLAACGNIMPAVTSIYRWREEIHRESEAFVLLKTSAANAERVVQRIAELHPYDVPEALVLDVAHGLPSYMQWIHESTQEVEEG